MYPKICFHVFNYLTNSRFLTCYSAGNSMEWNSVGCRTNPSIVVVGEAKTQPVIRLPGRSVTTKANVAMREIRRLTSGKAYPHYLNSSFLQIKFEFYLNRLQIP